jgi:type IV pilus assembly protein PilW
MIVKLNSKFKISRGLTLVELMVALAVFSVLMLGLGTVFQTNRRNYNSQEAFARLQENARFALSVLTQEVREAGFNGCNPSINLMLDTSSPAYDPALFDFTASIDGYEYLGTGPGAPAFAMTDYDPNGESLANWSNSNPTAALADLNNALANQVVAGTDVLIIKGGTAIPEMQPNGNTPKNAASVTFDDLTGIPAGTIVVISDCTAADVFQNSNNDNAVSLARATGAGGYAPGNVNPASNDMSHDYKQDDVQIIVTSSDAYYIGQNAAGQPSLFRQRFDAGFVAGGGASVVPQEIAEGVENMQILYGEDTSGDFVPDRYVTADAITNTRAIVSVRIALLMRTPDNLPYRPDDNVNYTLLGAAATGTDTVINPNGGAEDQRLRRVFGTTVFLRNAAVCRQRVGETRC